MSQSPNKLLFMPVYHVLYMLLSVLKASRQLAPTHYNQSVLNAAIDQYRSLIEKIKGKMTLLN